MKVLTSAMRRSLNTWIKSILIIAFAVVLLQRLFAQEDIDTLWHQLFVTIQAGNIWMLCLAVALMPVNWFVEVVKWRLLMQPVVRLSWRRAIAGVLGGITFSLFTPNRIGEYGGRMLFVDARHNWHAVVASLTGSFAQNLVHVSVGGIAIFTLLSWIVLLSQVTGRGMLILLVLMICTLWVIYLRLPEFMRFVQRWQPPRLLSKLWQALDHVATMQRTRLIQTLILATCRYVIFSVQYLLILKYCGVNVPWELLAGGVAVIYLVQTSIPLPPVVDLIARNEIGILLWAGYGAMELHIISAGLCIWVINLAFPALCGLIAITSINILRSLGYEGIPDITASRQRDNALDRTA